MAKKFSRFMMKFVSFLIVGTMILGSMMVILDQREVKGLVIIDINGDVTIVTDETWQDAIYRVDGNVTISANAELTVRNGGIVFLQDITHVHHLTIQQPGGTLHLTNSTVSTWLDQINSYPKLNMHVYGNLEMDTGSQLRFPGTLNAYAGSSVVMRDSVITGFSRQELGTYVGGDPDEYDDAPVMTFTDSAVELYDSRIEKIYENTASPGPDFRYNVTLKGSTEMTIVNSYVGVDFSNYNYRHNVILADDTSIVYIYNMTIDQSQSPDSNSQRSPCLQPYGNIILGSGTALPDSIHPTKDTTTTPGQDETNLQLDDNVRYVVKPLERMYVDGFDMDLPYVMTSATLWVTYSTDPAYDGTRPIQWGLEGEPWLYDTTITPVDTGGVGNELTNSFDIYGAGMDTFNELRYLDMAFYNDALAAASVYFERIWIDVDYFVIDSQAIFYIHRWLVPTVRDENGAPVENATVDISFLADPSLLPEYPRNGWANDPSSDILTYLGKTVGTYKTTGPDGKAWIPLLSEWMNSTLLQPTFPNTEFIGNYNATATYPSYSAFATMSFNPYPAMTESDNTYVLDIYLIGLVLPEPDLTPTLIWTDPAIIHVGNNVTINTTIANVGEWPAIDIRVDFTVGSDILPSCNISLLEADNSANCSSEWINATVGTHLVIVDVDPPIDTGGIIQELNEGNNRLTLPIYVEPYYPDLVVFVSAPGQGYPGNPLTITAMIQNTGNAPVTNSFFVEFFVDQDSIDLVTYSLELDIGGTDFVYAEWTPREVGDYTIRVVVDPTDTVEEISEVNNEATWDIQVVPVPNLVVISDNVSPDDPCPSAGQNIRANAWISNAGQVDADIFEVSFWIDGVSVGTWTSPAILVPGATVLAISPLSAPAGSPGFGEITVVVDPTDAIRESDNDDNTVIAPYMVYTGSQTVWSFDKTMDSVNVSATNNLVITGNIVFVNAELTVTQGSHNRHYVKIQNGGSLTLINSDLKTNFDNNWPLNVCVLDGGELIAEQNSQVLLDSPDHGKGALFTRGNGRIDLKDTVLDGDIRATGFDVSLKGVDLTGDVVFIYAQNTSYIWDTVFSTVATLSLNTDDGDVGTLDFDIRNVSFADPDLDKQLVFGGDQWVWLTDVETYIPTGEDWWTNMIVGNAKVSVYYWLTIELVDGTGALLPTSSLTLYHLDSDTLNWSVAVDDLGNLVQDVILPNGTYLYRALSQIRFVVDHYEPWTYMANGSKDIPVEGTYYPDKDRAENVMSNITIQLVFSALTPELWIEEISFIGGNGISNDQPYNLPLDVSAAIHNDGKITTRNVEVYFFSTDIDPDGNGIMENEPSTLDVYYIGVAIIEVPANGTRNATVRWNESGPTMVAAGNKVSVFVDMYDKINEVNELNNIDLDVVTMFRWPDLEVPVVDIISIPTQVPVFSSVTLQAKIRNIGSAEATNVRVEFLDYGTSIGNDMIPIIQSSGSALATVDWTATSSGPHEITVIAYTENLTIENTDYNWDNNEASITKSVLSVPDLMVDSTSVMGLGTPPNVTQAKPFTFTVRVYNLGQSSVSSFAIDAYIDSTADPSIAGLTDLSIGGDTYSDYELSVLNGLPDTGTYDLIVVVDATDQVPEGNETNNDVTISLLVVPPEGFVTISQPVANKKFEPGTTIWIRGSVQTNARDPIPGITIHVDLLGTVASGDYVTDSGGEFFITDFVIPDDIKGTYTIEVSTYIVSITEANVTIRVEKEIPWWETPFLGLPLWLWIIIIIIIVVIIIAVSVYLKYVGLGKLVECGNCGAFIPESSEKCPKCGVEFEKDLAKCSSCGAWIPIGVKVCPECGVEFATGELEMEEYREKMRMQYDEVVAKFRAEADKALGRTLSEEEFQDWWMTQPTFVTFEEWLREEEEMRKMGSRPCPSCGTLNSVTAKVCHKCGTLFEEIEEAPVAGKEPPAKKPPVKPAAAPPAAPPAEKKLEKLEKPVPKKVVKKPVDRPVVQKKVIKKPVAEEETEGEV